MDIFERRESEVRSYCRTFDTTFVKAKGSLMTDESGKEYVDFFAGAGALNYGHNDEAMKRAMLNYIESDSIVHSLDMYTVAKREFLKEFERVILNPRKMDYKVMFTGPTGTNAVEAALKLARKVTGRPTVVSFSNGFHGMTLGALSVTGNESKRSGAGVPLSNTSSMPFCGYFGKEIDTIEMVERYLEDSSSGVDVPAAFIVETVQGEGGINVASSEWLKRLSELASRHGILLIVDDIQMGCGRTGPFFSFERAGIKPDIITLSKSLSGFGTPFAVTLFKPEYDQWSPGEHNGTFRGHNLAFVTAREALGYWRDDRLEKKVLDDGAYIENRLSQLSSMGEKLIESARGVGLIWGIEFKDHKMAGKIARQAFKHGLIAETSGANDEVLKVMPALTIERELLRQGLDILEACIEDNLRSKKESKSQSLVTNAA